MLNDAGGRELLLRQYGLRKVPVVARGDKYVLSQLLEDFAEFVGLHSGSSQRLPPVELFGKYRNILATAQRYMRQMPDQHINERAMPNRDRIIRTLAYHVFRIGEAFLETWNGATHTPEIYNNDPDDSLQTGAQLADYGASVWQRLETWWQTNDDRELARIIKTYYGDISAHRVFERATWHSAQHVRQLRAVLERLNIAPDGELSVEDLAGLPMPERVWE